MWEKGAVNKIAKDILKHLALGSPYCVSLDLVLMLDVGGGVTPRMPEEPPSLLQTD